MASKARNAKILCGMLVGMTEDDANDVIASGKMTARVVMRDGAPYVVTRDFKADRINLRIQNGNVTEAEVG